MLKFFSGEKKGGSLLGVSCSDLGLEVETELHTAHDSMGCLSGIKISPGLRQASHRTASDQREVSTDVCRLGPMRYQVLMILYFDVFFAGIFLITHFRGIKQCSMYGSFEGFPLNTGMGACLGW